MSGQPFDQFYADDTLGMAPGTVGAHLNRALASLRLALSGSDYEEAAQ